MFVEEWKQARKSFEAVTQKKKPCEKFMGVFNKSTGIAAAVKDLDASLDKCDAEKMSAAEKAFGKVVSDYVPILVKAAKDDPSPTYVKEVEKLGQALQQIGVDYAELRKKTNLEVSQTIADGIIELYKDFIKAAKPYQTQANAAKRQAILDNGACSDALTALVVAGTKADANGVKAALATIATNIKKIDAAIKVNEANLAKLQTAFSKINDGFKKAKDDLIPAQVKGVQGERDRADGIYLQIGELIRLMGEELEEAQATGKEAAAAATDASKFSALLLKSVKQLSVRAIKLSGPLDAATQDIDGKLDQQRDRIGGELANEADPSKKKKIAENIRMKLEASRADAVSQGKETRANIKEILEAVSRLPGTAMGNPDVRKQLDEVMKSIADMEKTADKFEKAEAKADKILKTVP